MPKAPKLRGQESKVASKQVKIDMLRSSYRKSAIFVQECLTALRLFDIIRFSIVFSVIGRVFAFAIQNPQDSLSHAVFVECN